jgi:hypothetical protein
MLFWLTFKTNRRKEVFIAEAGSLGLARMKAGVRGQKGEFQEGHQIDSKTAKRIPKQMIGRTLSREEAERLLKRL